VEVRKLPGLGNNNGTCVKKKKPFVERRHGPTQGVTSRRHAVAVNGVVRVPLIIGGRPVHGGARGHIRFWLG